MVTAEDPSRWGKKFLPGGKVDGCFHLLGKEPEKNLCVAEGYATAATIHEATGYAVAVAFNVGTYSQSQRNYERSIQRHSFSYVQMMIGRLRVIRV